MNQNEFTERTQYHPTPEEWQIITQVYNFHPAIDDVMGKEQIAAIFFGGGMGLIKDMVKAAEGMERLENQIRDEQQAVLDAKADLDRTIAQRKELRDSYKITKKEN